MTTPPYGAPPPPYGAPPPPYGPPGYGYGQPGWSGPAYYFGPPGRIRPTGTSILLFIVTLGIYGFIYNYQVHDEMKRHSGRGIGGGIALLLTFLAGVAMPFITPMEVGGLYALRGRRPPVNGWTGLWYLVPAFGGWFAGFIALFAVSATAASTGSPSAAFSVAFLFPLIFIGAAIAGGIVWFMKTNDALNAYWQSLGVRP